MKIMGHKKSTVKSRATHILRNQMKIMGHKKSTVKSRATHNLRKPNEDNGPQEEYSEKQGNSHPKETK
jgi:hypothetical protein